MTPDLAKTLTDHIFHFYFPPLKGIIWIVFLFILVISCISYQFFPQGSGLLIVLRSMLEVLDNFSASTDLYTLKYFCRVFELLFVSRLRLSFFLITNITLSSFTNYNSFSPFFRIIFISFLESLSHVFLCCYFLT